MSDKDNVKYDKDLPEVQNKYNTKKRLNLKMVKIKIIINRLISHL